MYLRLKSGLTLFSHPNMIHQKRYRGKVYVWVNTVDIWDLLIKGFRWDIYSEPAVFSLGWQCTPSPSRLFLCLLQKCTNFHLPLSAGVLTGLISLAVGLLSCWHMKYLSHMMISQSRDNCSHSQLREAFADQADLVVETIYCFHTPG